MTAIATYHGEQIIATYHADTQRADYGVPGSPVFEEVIISSIECVKLEIAGVDVEITDLPEALQASILELAAEVEFESGE